MRQRLQYIDRLKGFAILAVIFGHLCMWQLGSFHSPTWFVGTFHMATFLFLSGLVITPPSISKCITKLMQFMFPALIIGSIYAYYKNTDILRFLHHDSKLGYWYLFVLSEYYVMMMFYHYVNKFDGKKGVIADIVFAVVAFVCLAGLHFLFGKKVSDLFCVYKMCTHWPVFFLGYMVKKYKGLNEFVFSKVGYSIMLLAYVLCLFLDYREIWYYIGIPMGVFAALFFANLFQRREQQTSLVEKELARLGRNSLDIYIYHFFFLWTISLHPVGTYCYETGNMLLFVLIAAGLSVVIAYICLLVGYILKSSTLLQTIIYGNR